MSFQFWHRLDKKKQFQVLLAGSLLFVAMYFILWDLAQVKDLAQAENMLSRAENRLEARSKAPTKLPESSAAIQKNTEILEKKLADIITQLNSQSSVLLDVTDVQAYQTLKLEISDLAKTHKIVINSVKDINRSKTRTALDTNNIWQRPLIDYSMNTSFKELLYFIEDLALLRNATAVVAIDVSVVELSSEEMRQARNTQLIAKLTLAL